MDNSSKTNNDEKNDNKSIPKLIIFAVVVIVIVGVVILTSSNDTTNNEEDNNEEQVNQNTQEDNGGSENNTEESNVEEVTTEGDSLELASSDYVVNCSLFSIDKLNNYPDYGSAISDIENSIASMNEFEVPNGLEDFNILMIDGWNIVLNFAKSQESGDAFDKDNAELQVATQLFDAANKNITSSARKILTDEGCIGVA